eukprot:TRINITY_DN2505_c0_g3_i1.p1 TRINITY_DN2505_c0_g3~~TRINITY_DN2505_c0_g3_i1.p1  ORF type:complete len:303 (+),score=63.12 TRINITY_DN2505_c0_g3_i1:293-1201(+)
MIITSLFLLLAAFSVMIFVSLKALQLRRRMMNLFNQDSNIEVFEHVTHVNYDEIEFDWERHDADSELGTASWKGSLVSVRRMPIQSNVVNFPHSFSLLMTKLGEMKDKNVLKYLGYLIAEEEVLILTEYFSFGTLYDQLKVSPLDTLPWEKRIGMIKDIAKGLVYLHSKSVYHLALNPKSIIPFLLDDKQRYKIGFAGLWNSNLIELPTNIQADDAVFMSPEMLLEDEVVDPSKCDIYSLGILMAYVCLEIPFSRMIDPSFSSIEKRNSSGLSNIHSITFSCLQQNAKSRPSLTNILLILGE